MTMHMHRDVVLKRPVDVSRTADRDAQRSDFATLTAQLVADFAARLPAGAVVRCVGRCRETLLTQGVRDGLVPAVEGMARTVLSRGLPAHHGR